MLRELSGGRNVLGGADDVGETFFAKGEVDWLVEVNIGELIDSLAHSIDRVSQPSSGMQDPRKVPVLKLRSE